MTMDWPWLLNVSVSLALGIAILVLVSLGLAVLFGMMGIINLAHGEFLMLGAFATVGGVRLGLPLVLAMLFAVAGVAALGWLLERLLVRHLYGRLTESILATWGLGLILAQAATLVFGTSPQGIATPGGSFTVGSYSIAGYSLVLIVGALLLPALLYLIFTRTRYGVMARAAMHMPHMAAAVGIDARRTHATTFALGTALAAAAGALLAPLVGVMPTMGQAYIARAFMTVIVGGSSPLSGTVAAAALLGGVENAVSYLLTPFLGQAALLLLAMMLVRIMPAGISGRWQRAI